MTKLSQMKNNKLLNLRVIPKQARPLTFEQRVIEETKININNKVVVFWSLNEGIYTFFSGYLMTKRWLLLRRPFCFSLLNFIQFCLWDLWFLLVPFCLARWFQLCMRVQENHGDLFYIYFYICMCMCMCVRCQGDSIFFFLMGCQRDSYSQNQL